MKIARLIFILSVVLAFSAILNGTVYVGTRNDCV